MIDYSDDNVTAHIEPRLENVRDNIRINRLAAFLVDTVADDDMTAALIYYPRCVSCASGFVIIDKKEIPLLELTFEQFMNLPGPLFTVWVNKVFEINPHFIDAGEKAVTSEADAEKKSK